MTAIELHDVSFNPAGHSGISGASLHIRPGTLLGIVGGPGSGKTTLVRLLTGVYRPRSGMVRVLNHDPLRLNARTRQRIALMLQPEALPDELTVTEQLNLVASLYGIDMDVRHKRIHTALTTLRLSDLHNTPIAVLSPYARRRLALACTLIQSPSLIIADEPAGGLDAAQRDRLWTDLETVHNHQRTVVVTTRYADDAWRCDIVAVLGHGELLCSDTPRGLCRRVLDGDLLRLCVAPERYEQARRIVAPASGVTSVRRVDRNHMGMVIQVDDAQRRLPQLDAILRQAFNRDEYQLDEYRVSLGRVIEYLIETGVGGCQPKRTQMV